MKNLMLTIMIAFTLNVSAQWEGYTTYELDDNLLPEPTMKMEVNVFDDIEVYEYDENLVPYPTRVIREDVLITPYRLNQDQILNRSGEVKPVRREPLNTGLWNQ